jgi:hypothetical protein
LSAVYCIKPPVNSNNFEKKLRSTVLKKRENVDVIKNVPQGQSV